MEIIHAAVRPLKILLIDDHQGTLRAMSTLLKMDGHDVTVAINVTEGIAKTVNETFDVLVCDLLLSDGDANNLLRNALVTSPTVGIVMGDHASHEKLQKPAPPVSQFTWRNPCQ